jgi:DNA repair exonuclease SbcCD ATPase subunit
MAFKIRNITVKNFMSVGNQTQAVDFDKEHLTLVLGENLDLGGDDSGSRNGTGKTTIVNALSYALYGQALTNIKKENLINKINQKNMLVTVEFEKDGSKYRIERGRKPNILKVYINDQEQQDQTAVDESQGDSRETQKFIDHAMGMSHTMFRHLVALNTYTEPFLSMKAAEQREVIEQLLGITLLSEKAEVLKVLVKESKDAVQVETLRIDSIKNANVNVQKSIDSLALKSSAWNTKKEEDIESLAKAMMKLENVDIAAELEAHTALKVWEEQNSKLKDLNRQKASYDTALGQAEKTVKKYERDVLALADKKCPQCEQDLHDHKHELLIDEATKNLEDALAYQESVTTNLTALQDQVAEINNLPVKPTTFYETHAEALGHKNNLDNLERALTAKIEEANPYDEQVEELKNTALQEISWDVVNEVTKIKDHQEFLLKLLTNKDSFIRKKIIDQNLNYLNNRLSYYIDKLGLPHSVVFLNDLNVEISYFGQDLDFDNLSRGERNRLILSMSFAFRDVWENLYQSINLLFVDELMDAGMDSAGVEAGLGILKKMARERDKNIYLISHKEELVGRVNNVLHVVKENGFTSYSNDVDYVEPQ